MSIIQVFICDGCQKEFREFDHETNAVTLKIDPEGGFSDAYSHFEELEKINVICNDCASDVKDSIIFLFNKKRSDLSD